MRRTTERRIDPERARRRRRLVLGLSSLPVAVAVVVVAVYLLSLSATTSRAIGYYDSGSFAKSEKQSSGLVDLNFVERWIPYFNRGDAKAGDHDYTAAVDDFEKALALAPKDRKCEVRVNLAQSWETLGDIYEQGGYHQGAVQLYQAAKDVIAAAGDDCPPNTAGSQALGKIGDDSDQKQQWSQQAQNQQDAQNPGSDGSKLDDLGKEQQQGEQQKHDDQARQGGTGGGTTDKPW